MGDIAKARGFDVRYPIRIDHIHRDDTTGNWYLMDEEGVDQGSFHTVLSASAKTANRNLVWGFP